MKADTRQACSQEQIHLPGTIQPHGALLALDPARGFTVVAASRNADRLLTGDPRPGGMTGRTVDSVLGAGFAASLRQRFDDGRLRREVPWQCGLELSGPSQAFEATVHVHSGLVLVELEAANLRDEAAILTSVRQLRETIVDLRTATDQVEGLARIATRGVRLLTGYDRVLIYRYDLDWNGESIGEDKVADWNESLDGLTSPASNVPAQARELYRRSPMRWVADGDAMPVPLDIDPVWAAETALQQPRHAVDLSFSYLRSLSPKHLQFYRSMGIHGSLSLSILHEGKLWGLMVCHHRKPHAISFGQRTAAVALTDAFALRVGLAERTAIEQARRGDLVRLSTVLAQMTGTETVADALTAANATIGSLFASTGAAVIYDGEITVLGHTPPKTDIRKLADWLQEQTGTAKQFQVNNLGVVYPEWIPHTAIAAGLLAVSLSPDRPDMLLWFRPNEPQLVNWGGNPYNGTLDDPSNPPQLSFERWVEMRHGARPWAEWELEIAEALRHGMIDVIVRSLRHTAKIAAVDQASQATEAALLRSNEALRNSVQAQLVQQESEARFRFATQAGRLGVWELDLKTYELTASAVCKDNFGYAADAPFSYQHMQDAIDPGDRERMKTALEHSIVTGSEYDIECRVARPNGVAGWVQMHAQVERTVDGAALRIAGISLDITERVRLEERLRQSQRVEAIGQLTAGVAHDFNNLLQTLLGRIELALEKGRDRPDICTHLDRALKAGERGVRLTSHLLSFSRMQVLRPVATELTPLLMELSRTLDHTLGHDVAVSLDIASDLPFVLVDAAHLDSALLNLALNARDAMPQGGKLKIEAYTKLGQVVIAVTDTGEGMTADVMAHACEPFFTTKGPMDSGLGLPMAQGFARQSGGELKIQSTPGQGTRVEIWLPLAVRIGVLAPNLQPRQLEGKGRVLVVDDDADVGELTSDILRAAGFDVMTVGGGSAALHALSASVKFDALVTDYIMPVMNGRDLVLQARRLQQELPALVITGYPKGEGLDRLPSNVTVLRKPFHGEEIVRRVEGLVEGAGRLKPRTATL